MNISINACSAYCGDLLWTNEAFKIVTESLSKTNQRAIISSGWNNVYIIIKFLKVCYNIIKAHSCSII